MAAHAMTSKQAIDFIRSNIPSNASPAAVTNATENTPARPPATPPTVPTTESAAAGIVAVGDFARPSIGVYNGVITVAAEGSGMGSTWSYRLVNGKWVGGKDVTGSDQTADRVYVVSVCNGIYSYRYGPKTGGSWKGPGLWINGKEIRTQLTTGAARLAADSKGVILMSKDANWGRVNPDGSIGQRGHFAGLTTGEKIAFDASGSTWAVGMGGFSRQDASVAVGTESGGRVTPVIAYSLFPGDSGMSSDMAYVSVSINGPVVWFAANYGGKLRLNSVEDGKARWSPTAPKTIADGNQGDRCPPRLATARGRTHVIWQAGGDIMRVDALNACKAALNPLHASPTRVCSGSQPAVCVGPDGTIYLVYLSGGAIRFRVL